MATPVSPVPIAMREANHRLTHYVTRAAAGDEFLIMRHGKPLARLGPAAPPGRNDSRLAKIRDEKIKSALSVRALKAWPGGKFRRSDAYEE